MTLFEDPQFPIEGESRRPFELVNSPKFFGHSCHVDHGWRYCFERRGEIKGNHAKFFLIAVSSLTKDLNNFLKVVPEQSFDERYYNGKFKFKFFDHDGPITIEVDDLLPICSNGSLKYSESVSNTFWYPLLEKAYAKFRGGYDRIETGLLIESFFHLTGKKAECFDSGAGTSLPFTPSGMYSKLKMLIDNKSLLVCKLKDPIGNNQLYGSGFTIIDISEGKRLSNDGFDARNQLVKLRHPSGIIEKEMADEMGISEIDSFGEAFMDIEKFLNQMMCVYSVDMIQMDVLNRNRGLDAFLPFIPIPRDSSANRHRCRK